MKTSPQAENGSLVKNNRPLFHQLYETELHQLLDAFSINDRTVDGMLNATQLWAKGDHYAPENTLELLPEQERAIFELAVKAIMIDEIALPSVPIDRLVLLGGEQNSNQQRADWLANQLLNSSEALQAGGKIVTLGGNRTLKGREVMPLGYGFDRADKSDPWLQRQLMKKINDVLTEDTGVRVALLASLGILSLSQMYIRLGTADNRELVGYRSFRSKYGEIIAINAPAIRRPLGPPRHTTESSLLEWLAIDTDIRGDETVVLISSNPYILRTSRNFQKVIRSMYPLINLYTCGPAAVRDELLPRRILGEITRNIYEDVR
jgi:hypothetical protein